jgi:2-phosphosulfolactate phosphatase
MEDVIGAGAVLASLRAEPMSDTARMALRLFESARSDLPRVLRDAAGGRNILAAGLEADIDFAARVNAVPVVGVASGEPLVVRRMG